MIVCGITWKFEGPSQEQKLKAPNLVICTKGIHMNGLVIIEKVKAFYNVLKITDHCTFV
jgi:hypothetical protein